MHPKLPILLHVTSQLSYQWRLHFSNSQHLRLYSAFFSGETQTKMLNKFVNGNSMQLQTGLRSGHYKVVLGLVQDQEFLGLLGHRHLSLTKSPNEMYRKIISYHSRVCYVSNTFKCFTWVILILRKLHNYMNSSKLEWFTTIATLLYLMVFSQNLDKSGLEVT